MFKIIAFLGLLPLGVMAADVNSQDESVLQIRADHPQLQNLEVELESGETVNLREYLQFIADDEEVVVFGGEVPWPNSDDKKKNKK